ncbi:unnamed protein product, partial [Mesorhabditis spiculigera]
MRVITEWMGMQEMQPNGMTSITGSVDSAKYPAALMAISAPGHKTEPRLIDSLDGPDLWMLNLVFIMSLGFQIFIVELLEVVFISMDSADFPAPLVPLPSIVQLQLRNEVGQ